MYTFAPKQKKTPAADSVLQRKQSEGQSTGFVEHRPKAVYQKKANNTGLPDRLKEGIESLSGLDMSDVRVHRNSSKPAALQAFAYTQGTDIHVAPGQERHLPHEAWHAAQQKQGRVRPTGKVDGTPMNDSTALESEAGVMGAKALQTKPTAAVGGEGNPQPGAPVQMKAPGQIIQMQHILHRGVKKELADKACRQTSDAFQEGAGEFGEGLYFWYENPKAALISAIAYNGDKNWAVIKVTIPDDVYEQYVEKELEFPTASEAATEVEYGGRGKPDVEMKFNAEGRVHNVGTMMHVEEFRRANQVAGDDALAGGINDRTVWGYHAIKGPSAADYKDDSLIQIKFERSSMGMFLDPRVSIEIIAEGPTISSFGRFKMDEKNKRYEQLRKTKGVNINF